MAISNHEYRQMGNFNVYATFNKSLGQTAPSAWKCLKTQFWGPLTNWKFEPSPKAHTHSDLIINKHTGQKNYLRIYHGMHWTLCYRQKLSITLKSKDLATYRFQKKKLQTHPPKLTEPSFRQITLPPAKLCMLFPAHLWVRELWPQIYSLRQAWD